MWSVVNEVHRGIESPDRMVSDRTGEEARRKGSARADRRR
jgi:hypothetical protein